MSHVLSSTTNFSFDIDSIDVHTLTLHPSIEAAHLTVDGALEPGLLSVSSVSASLDIVASLQGQLVVDEINLREGDARLIRLANGDTTWANGVKKQAMQVKVFQPIRICPESDQSVCQI